MIREMRTLLRLKELKEKENMRLVSQRRESLASATKAAEEAAAAVAESVSTFSRREDALYAKIIGRIVDLSRLEETDADRAALEKQHESLLDDCRRADHVKARVEADLATATAALRKCVRDKDKYVSLTDDLQRVAADEAALKEEVEIEDLMSGRRRELHAS